MSISTFFFQLFLPVTMRFLKLPSFVFPEVFVPGKEAGPLTFQRELLQHSTSHTTVCNLEEEKKN